MHVEKSERRVAAAEAKYMKIMQFSPLLRQEMIAFEAKYMKIMQLLLFFQQKMFFRRKTTFLFR